MLTGRFPSVVSCHLNDPPTQLGGKVVSLSGGVLSVVAYPEARFFHGVVMAKTVGELIETLKRLDPKKPIVIGRLETEPADGQRFARDRYPIEAVGDEGDAVILAFDPDADPNADEESESAGE